MLTFNGQLEEDDSSKETEGAIRKGEGKPQSQGKEWSKIQNASKRSVKIQELKKAIRCGGMEVMSGLRESILSAVRSQTEGDAE